MRRLSDTSRIILWPCLLLTAAQACIFPHFLRFEYNQAWMSTWSRAGVNRISYLVLTGTRNEMILHKQTDRADCKNGCGIHNRLKSRYKCVLPIGRHKHRYIVRSTLPHYSNRPTGYYCVEFVPRNTFTKGTKMKVFFMRWDLRKRLSMNDFNCNFIDNHGIAQDVWIPSPSQERSWWNDCPFNGGFQTRMTDGRNNEEICPNSRLFRFDVDCVSGEGMVWVFPETRCNPFTKTRVSQFYCYLSWKYGRYTNVILYNMSSLSHVYTLRYDPNDIELMKQIGDSTRRTFYKSVIFLGAVEATSRQLSPVLSDDRVSYTLDYRIGNPSDPDCDDEVTNCVEQCHETMAYINCKKTCSRPREECLSNRDNNKCNFKKHYVSKWLVQITQKSGFVVHIRNDTVDFYRPGGKSEIMLSAACYNEIQSVRHKSLNDRYIIEVTHMPKGCRRRRLCLEMYQGRYVMKPDNNRNTVRYRISKSKIANLYTDHNQLCKFQPDPKPVGEKYRSKFMKMMIAKNRIERAYGLPMKCGIYRSMMARVDLSTSKYRSACEQVRINDWSSESCEYHSTLSIDHSACSRKWPYESGIEDYKCVGTYYTSHLGLTVTDSDSTNMMMVITKRYIKETDDTEYNCWFFDKVKENAHPKLYKFPTVDCAIFQKTKDKIVVDHSKATVTYIITGVTDQPCRKRQEGSPARNVEDRIDDDTNGDEYKYNNEVIDADERTYEREVEEKEETYDAYLSRDDRNKKYYGDKKPENDANSNFLIEQLCIFIPVLIHLWTLLTGVELI